MKYFFIFSFRRLCYFCNSKRTMLERRKKERAESRKTERAESELESKIKSDFEGTEL